VEAATEPATASVVSVHAQEATTCCAVADALRAEVPDFDFVAYFGGEEFSILVPGVHSQTSLPHTGDRVERLTVAVTGDQGDAAHRRHGAVHGQAGRTEPDLPAGARAAGPTGLRKGRDPRPRGGRWTGVSLNPLPGGGVAGCLWLCGARFWLPG
jgi:hypothetical protein